MPYRKLQRTRLGLRILGLVENVSAHDLLRERKALDELLRNSLKSRGPNSYGKGAVSKWNPMGKRLLHLEEVCHWKLRWLISNNPYLAAKMCQSGMKGTIGFY